MKCLQRVLLAAIVLMSGAMAFGLGASAADLAEIEKSAQAYRDGIIQSAAGLDPQLIDTSTAQSAEAEQAGRFGEAAAKLKQAIGLGRESGALWWKLSELEEKAGALDDAASAAFLGAQSAYGEQRGKALLRVGQLLDKANRVDLAIVAYTQGLRDTWDSDASGRLDQLRNSLAFHPVNSRLEMAGETPRACIEFQGMLQEPERIHYQDYVKLEPQVDASFALSDGGVTLCVAGLAYGTDYRVKLLPGLPSAEGEALAQGEELSFTVGDREPSIGFRESAYVLPKVGSTGVPVITVNTTEVALRLMRINDRKLTDQIVNQHFLIELSGYDAEDVAERDGELIWKGSMTVENQRNKRVVTAFPIQDVVKETKPGVYVLMAQPYTPGAEEEFRWQASATQWLVVSDLGLTTFSGSDGLTVSVHSLENGTPLNRVELRLIARNNEVLATAMSDRSGLAKFDPGLLRGAGGRTATAVMAFRKDGDFSFLDLTRGGFDLSDRGVGGRSMPGYFDLFFYSDRGVYRPGETVHLTGLLRDQGAKAITGEKITLKLLRPDGVESTRFDNLRDEGGGYQVDLPIAATARTGSWTVEAYVDPEGEPIADMSFLVEDVVPARIETEVKSSVTALAPDTEATVDVKAKFLYGAPAADLPVKADLTIARDADPFPDLKGYRFGLADEDVEPTRNPLDDSKTDAQGAATLPLSLGDLPDTAQPLAATLRVEVYEFGGRPVIKSQKIAIRNRPYSIGIKPVFEGDEAPSGASVDFEVIAVDAEGKPIDRAGLAYRFVQEEWDYQWFYANNAWDYDVVVRDKSVANGNLNATGAAPAKLSLNVDWGHYRLEVYDAASGTASSVRFYAGWWAKPGTATTPDRMQVVADKPLYQVGDQAEIRLEAPFVGQALVTIATDRVLESRLVDVPAGGSSIKVKVDAAWGAGAYVLVSAFRPGEADQHGPGRAIGTAWLAIDPKPRQLEVAMTVPDKVLPRQSVSIPVSVANLSGGAAYLTVAAVDEGILQLTDFETPDPVDHYFGKRRLGLEIRDLYGQLIDGKEGKRGEIREGGDEDGLGNRGAPPELKLVALFSGLVKLDDAGKAAIKFDIPDYNGRLRLMAVAWDGANVGSAEAGLVVRDPVVVLSSTPRFLAPGDQSAFSVSIQNLDAAAGSYHVVLEATDAVQLGDGAVFDAELKLGDTVRKAIPLLGKSLGTGKVTMTVTGPGGFNLSHDITVPVRPAQTPMSQTLSRVLQPGESFTLSKSALTRFLPETAALQASMSARPNLDVPRVLSDLSHYPYGCLEQTTSIAFPLLYVKELAATWGVDDASVAGDKERIQDAVNRALEHEGSNGQFGLWSASDTPDRWLSAYAMDFLTEAKAKGYQVSELGYRNGIKGLQLIMGGYYQEDPETLNARAYALYVLAKAKATNLSDLRYFNDTYLNRLPTPIAAAQIGAALAMTGDMERAGKAFAKAKTDAERALRGYWDYSSEWYGSGLRDSAAIIALMVEVKAPGADLASLLDRLASEMSTRSYLSTQEQAWILRAAYATSKDQAHLKVALSNGQGADRDTPYLWKAGLGDLDQDVAIKNEGDQVVYLRATASGVPVESQPAVSHGAEVDRQFFTLDGKPVDITKLKQNDIVVAVITGQFNDQANHRAMVIDLLPAGLEIENERLNNNRRTGDLAWLPELSGGTFGESSYVEYRDDRFIAAFDTRPDQQGFTFAYMLRAVTPGQYKAPAVELEDMYKPELRARGPMGTASVAAYQ
ncbi:MG2 domain-containing protein [Dongia sp.]|uniref:alpha-2-macroglobulin family protein n=1 Tax=Dongia sp. TaxID=1977262 RepID=UPI003751DAFD